MARMVVLLLLIVSLVACSQRADKQPEANALLTEHEHGHTVWLDKPSTAFYLLHTSGRAIHIPDPIMEGPEEWESVEKMRKRFSACKAPLLPPTGGAAKLWSQSPAIWEDLGCVKRQSWHKVTIGKSERGMIVGPLPKGQGRNDKFMLIINGGTWRNQDEGEAVAQAHLLSQIPTLLMGSEGRQ